MNRKWHCIISLCIRLEYYQTDDVRQRLGIALDAFSLGEYGWDQKRPVAYEVLEPEYCTMFALHDRFKQRGDLRAERKAALTGPLLGSNLELLNQEQVRNGLVEKFSKLIKLNLAIFWLQTIFAVNRSVDRLKFYEITRSRILWSTLSDLRF